MEDKYISSLDKYEKLALFIAKDHLKSSFSIKRSIGYKHFLLSS